MFENIRFDGTHLNLLPTIGDIAELVVFYDHVKIVVPGFYLDKMLSYEMGENIPFLLDLIDDCRLSIVIDTSPFSEFNLINFKNFSFGDVDGESSFMNRDELIKYKEDQIDSLNINTPRNFRGMIKSLLDRVSFIEDLDENIIEKRKNGAIRFCDYVENNDILPDLFNSCLRDPSINRDIEVEVKRHLGSDGLPRLSISTSDFFDRGGTYPADIRKLSSLAYYIVEYMLVNPEVGVDTYTPPKLIEFFQRRATAPMQQLNNIINPSSYDVELFQKVIFGNGIDIKTAIDSREKKLSDISDMIKNRANFSKFLRGKPNDKSLVEWYFMEMSKNNMSSLPMKALRWAGVTASGAALGAAMAGVPGIIAGAGLGFIDSFFLDKVSIGYKPSAFVQGDLKQFLLKKD